MKNWIKSGHNLWRHRIRPALQVYIRRNANPKRKEKYQVYHNHPTKDGKVVSQPFDYAWSMEDARRKARVHMHHWSEPDMWPRYWK